MNGEKKIRPTKRLSLFKNDKLENFLRRQSDIIKSKRESWRVRKICFVALMRYFKQHSTHFSFRLFKFFKNFVQIVQFMVFNIGLTENATGLNGLSLIDIRNFSIIVINASFI